MVVLEAAACSLPLLLRDLPVYTSLFGDLYLKGQDGEFASMLMALKSDRKLREQYTRRAQILSEKYDIDKMLRKLITLYRQVLEN